MSAMSRVQASTPAPLARTPARVPVRSATTRAMRTTAGNAKEIDRVTGKKRPDPVDIYIGQRVQIRRKMMGMSQEKLGTAIGLTFQQVQKYERGTNRMGGSRLQQVANALGCNVAFFYEGAPNSLRADGTPATEIDPAITKFLATTEGIRVAQEFTRIPSARVRGVLVNLIEMLAESK